MAWEESAVLLVRSLASVGRHSPTQTDSPGISGQVS
jgi:hypothetical protein